MSNEVLFVSQNPLGRCENLETVFDAYDGEKAFRCGMDAMRSAERDGFAAVVCDALPAYIEGKDRCKSIVLCHGITGNKVYGLDETGNWQDRAAYEQTDWATAASTASVPIVARQLGISEDKVLPLGFPRTDAYVGMAKGDGCTFLALKRAYLYAPTFRDAELGGWLPRIDWNKVDSLMNGDEMFVIKRHYFTQEPLTSRKYNHIFEIDPMAPLIPYLADCDAVLTDYSSVMSDAYLLGKPCVLAMDDMDEYLADRGMYYKYPTEYSGNWIRFAEGNEDLLVQVMRNAVEDGLCEIETRYRELTAGACDGHSTERTCELIRKVVGNG